MNIGQIRVFLAVYRAGSFVAVAKDLNVAPSSISRSISNLEDILKMRLFQRTTRKLMPTKAGEAYFGSIAPVMEEFDSLHNALADSSGGLKGHLRVSASVSYGQIVIAPLLKKFRDLYPQIALELILSDGRTDLIDERIDVAIRHGNLPDSSFIAQKISSVTYRLVASKSYLENAPSLEAPDDLPSHDLITFSYDDFRRAWKFHQNGKTQTVPIQAALIVTNAAAIRQCARDGAGIALLADWTVKEDLQSGKLTKLLPQWQASGTVKEANIWLIYPSSRFIPAKTRAFSEFMKEHLS